MHNSNHRHNSDQYGRGALLVPVLAYLSLIGCICLALAYVACEWLNVAYVCELLQRL